jgi:poly(ADP-ribose) glycohydrolase ARH3
VGTLIGDAAGRPFEGTPFGSLASLARAVRRRFERPEAWDYSDDGEMMLLLGESIAANRGVFEERVIDALARGHDPARGYGKGARIAFRAWLEGAGWREAATSAWAEGSKGNGAAARIAPVAVFHRADSREELVARAERSAAPTHLHPEALRGAAVAAVSVWSALSNRNRDEIMSDASAVAGPELEAPLRGARELSRLEDAAREIGTGVAAVESVPAALFAFYGSSSFEDAVTRAVLMGGDTDSIGAIAGAIAGAFYGRAQIPDALVQALDRAAIDRAETLAVALAR